MRALDGSCRADTPFSCVGRDQVDGEIGEGGIVVIDQLKCRMALHSSKLGFSFLPFLPFKLTLRDVISLHNSRLAYSKKRMSGETQLV